MKIILSISSYSLLTRESTSIRDEYEKYMLLLLVFIYMFLSAAIPRISSRLVPFWRLITKLNYCCMASQCSQLCWPMIKRGEAISNNKALKGNEEEAKILNNF